MIKKAIIRKYGIVKLPQQESNIERNITNTNQQSSPQFGLKPKNIMAKPQKPNPIKQQTQRMNYSLKNFNKITFYISNSANGDKIVKDMAYSMNETFSHAKHGYKGGLACTFGILRGADKLLKECIKNKYPFLYIDHSYFQSGHNAGNSWYRMTLNSLQRNTLGEYPGDRVEKLGIKLKEWRTTGDYILVCPPTPAISLFYGIDNWLDKTIQEIKKYSDRPIIIREKPKEIQVQMTAEGFAIPVKGDKNTKHKNIELPSIEEHFSKAWAVVTYNSNIGVEAAIEGIPVFCDNSSAAFPVGLTDLSKIEQPVLPDRTKWLNTLTYSQFKYEEFLSGYAFDILGI